MMKQTIKAIIFDFGQVLVHFDPEYILAEAIPDEAERKAAAEILFDRAYWDKLDDGTMTEADLCREALPRIKAEYRAPAEKAISNWYYRLPEWEGMRELLTKLKDAGYPVFLISNISRGFAEHSSEIPILSLIDKAVFSATADCVKPSAAIFDLACRTFGYAPEECVFIDDSEKNLKGAEAFGIHPIHFDGNAFKLRSTLSNLINFNPPTEP